SRAGARWLGWQHFSAAAFLDCRGLKPDQRLLRTLSFAGIAAAGAAYPLRLAARQPVRRTCVAAHPCRAAVARCRQLPWQSGACRSAERSVLYLMYRCGWDERCVGLTLAIVGICSIVVQGAVVGPVTKKIGERAALML